MQVAVPPSLPQGDALRSGTNVTANLVPPLFFFALGILARFLFFSLFHLNG